MLAREGFDVDKGSVCLSCMGRSSRYHVSRARRAVAAFPVEQIPLKKALMCFLVVTFAGSALSNAKPSELLLVALNRAVNLLFCRVPQPITNSLTLRLFLLLKNSPPMIPST
jgi:hypothetical protein